MKKMALGQIIRARRKELNFTTEELAKKVGIDRTYLTKIEKYGWLPSPEVLTAIITYLKDKPKKYIDIYESLKFGGVLKQWRQKNKTSTQ